MTNKTKIDLKDRIYILSTTYSNIKLFFGHWEAVPNLNIDKLYEQYLHKAISIEDRFQFYLLMNEFLTEFKNTHCFYNDMWVKQNYKSSIGLKLIYNNEWIIKESKIAGINPGDSIDKINNMDFENFYLQNKKYIPASSEKSSRHSLIYYSHLFPWKFNLQLKNNKEIEIDRKTVKINNTKKVECKLFHNKKICYISIPSFNEKEFEQNAVGYIKNYSSSKAIIIDVRGNEGGSTPSNLSNILHKKPRKWWIESTSTYIGSHHSRDYVQRSKYITEYKIENPSDNHYKGEVIILTDRFSCSACEDFVMQFKDNQGATIIGEITAGSTGQPYIFYPLEDICIGIGSISAIFPDGRNFEGVGILPDIEINYQKEDLVAGKDRILEKAVEIAKQFI